VSFKKNYFKYITHPQDKKKLWCFFSDCKENKVTIDVWVSMLVNKISCEPIFMWLTVVSRKPFHLFLIRLL